MKSYDFIIVGGGSAGCVLAGRLSENPLFSILLIEAGPKTQAENKILCPARFGDIINSELDWGFEDFTRGKMLGGCSNMNACVYMRGDPKALDEWPDGWKNKDLAPYFKKAEDCSNLPQDFLVNNKSERGFSGPMKLSFPGNNHKNENPLTEKFIQSCEEIGHPHTLDINNGLSQDGVSYHQFNVHNGERLSTERAYLKDRPNLKIICEEQVSKILFDHQKKAKGIECASGNVYCSNKEVIIAAGSIGSPWLLLLSGIGPKIHLEEVGVDLIHDSPVGTNLEDHVMTPFVFQCNQNLGIDHDSTSAREQWEKSRSGDLTDSGIQASLFLKSRLSSSKNDIQITFLAGIPEQIRNFMTLLLNKKMIQTLPPFLAKFMAVEKLTWIPPRLREFGRSFMNNSKMNLPKYGFVMFPVVGIPSSKGSIRLKSKDYRVHPIITYEASKKTEDRMVVIDAVRELRKISNSSVFQDIGAEEVIDITIPFDSNSDEYILQYTSQTASQGHAACTCPLGKVVDNSLKVMGTQSLRVVDASIIPNMVNGNIQCTIIAIAEKAADIIKDEYGARANDVPENVVAETAMS